MCLTTEDAVTFVYDSCRSIKNIIRNGLVPLSYHNAEYVCVTCTCQCHTGGLVVALWANRNESVSDRLKRYSHCAHAAQYRQSPPSPTHPPHTARLASRLLVHHFGSEKQVSARRRVVSVYYSVFDNIHRCLMNFMPDTHRRRDATATVESRRVGGVYWALALVSSCSCVAL